MFKRKSNRKHYWFTIVAANGQTLATSETYTTAAMRDKGIEATKTAVLKAAGIGKINAPGWKVSEVKRDRRFAKRGLVSNASTVQFTGDRVKFPSLSDDTFNLENKKGKIVKR